jgi:hypothetical protein
MARPILRRLAGVVSGALALATAAVPLAPTAADAAPLPPGCTASSPPSWSWSASFNRPSGWCLASRGFYLVMQADGNFVLYNGSIPLWSSRTSPGTDTPGRYIAFQHDGNVVIIGDKIYVQFHVTIKSVNVPVWSADAYGNWFRHPLCTSANPAVKYYAELHPAGDGQGTHVDFGMVCANGKRFNNFAIDPDRVPAPGLRPYY